MKFKVGDQVKKKSGYPFIGKVVSAYLTHTGEHYDVMMNPTEGASDTIRDMLESSVNADLITPMDMKYIMQWVENGDGMIYIFTDKQLERV